MKKQDGSVPAFHFSVLTSAFFISVPVLFWNRLSNLTKIGDWRGASAGRFLGKPGISHIWKHGASIALQSAMSTPLDSLYKKMAASLESGGEGRAREAKNDPARHISPAVAHELNNILTIIQGYTDRLLLKHGENPAIQAHLKLIAEAARRASTLVRTSVATEVDRQPHPQPCPPLPPPPAA